jgi:hypothetical protein
VAVADRVPHVVDAAAASDDIEAESLGDRCLFSVAGGEGDRLTRPGEIRRTARAATAKCQASMA